MRAETTLWSCAIPWYVTVFDHRLTRSETTAELLKMHTLACIIMLANCMHV